MASIRFGEELSNLFALIDADGDGVITTAEVEQLLTSMDVIVDPSEASALRELIATKGFLNRADFCFGLISNQSWGPINCSGICLR